MDGVLQPPHMPPTAAVSALVTCADAWLPRPRTARPDLNPLDTTPIPTEYNRPANAGSVGECAARAEGWDGDVGDVGQRRTGLGSKCHVRRRAALRCDQSGLWCWIMRSVSTSAALPTGSR